MTTSSAFKRASNTTIGKVLKVLGAIRNNSSSGRGIIPYPLLKLIKDTPLGRALIHVIPRSIEGDVRVPKEHRESMMVMIPKAGKDWIKFKGWRPIILANTVGKLGEKVMADHIQQKTHLFHSLQYGSRKGRSATDAMKLIISKAQREVQPGHRLTLLGKDVVSAFNHLQGKHLVNVLSQMDLGDVAELCLTFLTVRKLKIFWDMEERGVVQMDAGTPQGSPLSPEFWLFCIAGTLKMADGRSSAIQLTPRRTSARLERRGIRRAAVGISINLFSYADGVNPLVVREVETILEEEAAGDGLRWDPNKESDVSFGVAGATVTLGIHINSKLDFQPHIDARAAKAEQLRKLMTRLGNSRGGMSPRAMRALYTGAVRPIFTLGAELWN